MSYDLAIIIPAYRAKYLNKALESLASQTDKRFTIYIGDDASPEDLKSIAESYGQRVDIRYTRFEENLGGKDLVAQWERCINLSSEEEWIWLFSDDDEMESRCVESFHKAEKQFDLMHFNVDVIDAESKVIESSSFPEHLNTKDFTRLRLRGKIRSYAVEYVLKRDALLKCGGFVNFDMAWCSDDATWITLAGERGILTIQGPRVRWRRSDINITSDLRNASTVRRKIEASLDYVKWLIDRRLWSPWILTWFVTSLYNMRKALTEEDIRLYMRRFSQTGGGCLCAEYAFYIFKTLKRGK